LTTRDPAAASLPWAPRESRTESKIEDDLSDIHAGIFHAKLALDQLSERARGPARSRKAMRLWVASQGGRDSIERFLT
jgi:hypothetical protein